MKGQIVSSGTFVIPIGIGARRAQPADDLGVLARRLVDGPAPERVELSGDVELVLDRDRDAQQRRRLAGVQSRLGVLGLRQRLLAEHDPERVQSRVEPLDPLEVELHQLARRDLARAQQLGLPRGPGKRQVLPARRLRCAGARTGRAHGAIVSGRARTPGLRLPWNRWISGSSRS